MKKISGAGIAVLLCASALAGCGGSDDSSSGGYCDDIGAARTQFKDLSDSDITGDNFSAIQDTIHKIADEAPDDVESSWTLLANQFDALQSALDDAGVSMDDFSKITSGDTSGIDPSKLTDLTTALQNFDTDGIASATTKITTEVKDECDIDMDADS